MAKLHLQQPSSGRVCILGASLICLLVGCATSDPVFFPKESIELPSPTRCENDASYCGGDLSKYPIEKIKVLIDQTVELQKSKENMEHFFRPLDEVRTKDPPESGAGTAAAQGNGESLLEPVCKSRKELLPRFTRAKNVDNKWVYLVEAAEHQRQEVELTICENVNVPCKNDFDSPHGRNTTVCKQLFRTQKLLAVDDTGEVVIDTFELPSACICNYKAVSGFALELRRGSELEKTLDCGDSSSSTPLSTPFQNFDQQGEDDKEQEDFGELSPKDGSRILMPDVAARGRPARYQRKQRQERQQELDKLEPVPCDRNNQTFGNLCQSEKYPESYVRSSLRSSKSVLGSPVHFKKLFELPCEYYDEPALRVGLSPTESPLCESYQSYVFPKVARNVYGQWRYIINIDEYQQGVTIEKCTREEDAPCLYGGHHGLYPEATGCRQRYTRHNMLTITGDRTVAYETFLIPSACVCHIRDPQVFI